MQGIQTGLQRIKNFWTLVGVTEVIVTESGNTAVQPSPNLPQTKFLV